MLLLPWSSTRQSCRKGLSEQRKRLAAPFGGGNVRDDEDAGCPLFVHEGRTCVRFDPTLALLVNNAHLARRDIEYLRRGGHQLAHGEHEAMHDTEYTRFLL